MPTAIRRIILWTTVAVLFLCLWAAKLWTLQLYGSDIPNWDQWDAEAAFLYIPWLDGSLRLENFFRAHNEHRILFTQLLNLGLLRANGQWDARLQCVINAALHASLGVAVWWWLRRHFSDRTNTLLLWVVAAFFAVPYSMQNVLGGFHSQQYFLLWMSLGAMCGLLASRPMSISWFASAFLCVAANFTMGSGVLAGAAVLAVAMLRVLLAPGKPWKPEIPTISVALLACLVGVLTRADAQNHVHMRARNISDFVLTAAHCFEWPFHITAWGALFCYAPALFFIVVYLRRRASNTGFDHVLLVSLAWIALQVFATAYARGAEALYPASRYLDTLSLGTFLNVIAAVRLLQINQARTKKSVIPAALAGVWFATIGVGLWLEIKASLVHTYPAVHSQMVERERNLRAYVATENPVHLVGKEIPYPSADIIIERLSNEKLVDLLPVSVRKPLVTPAAFSKTAFVRNGIPPGVEAATPGDAVMGSFDATGASNQGEWSSSHVFSEGAKLQFEVLGQSDGEQVSILLSGKKVQRLPMGGLSPSAWSSVLIDVPGSSFRLEARDESNTGWIAFAQPREMAWLSAHALQLTNAGRLLTTIALAGLGVLTLILLLTAAGRDARRKAHKPTLTAT